MEDGLKLHVSTGNRRSSSNNNNNNNNNQHQHQQQHSHHSSGNGSGSNNSNSNHNTATTSSTTSHGHSTSSPASSRITKPAHRNAKRPTHPTYSPTHDHGPVSPHSSAMDRHKRVWKACERCRMKKTKCDGEFPCKRCKDDGLVCTAGTRKKTEYKQLPRG